MDDTTRTFDWREFLKPPQRQADARDLLAVLKQNHPLVAAAGERDPRIVGAAGARVVRDGNHERLRGYNELFLGDRGSPGIFESDARRDGPRGVCRSIADGRRR